MKASTHIVKHDDVPAFVQAQVKPTIVLNADSEFVAIAVADDESDSNSVPAEAAGRKKGKE